MAVIDLTNEVATAGTQTATLHQPPPQKTDEDKLNNFFETFVSTMTNLQQNNGMGQVYNHHGGLTISGQSLKMLHGTGKPSTFAWAGLTLQDDTPELLSILDSNEDITIKFHALESWLQAAQCKNPFVIFTLCIRGQSIVRNS